jgi:hypothetical protein
MDEYGKMTVKMLIASYQALGSKVQRQISNS